MYEIAPLDERPISKDELDRLGSLQVLQDRGQLVVRELPSDRLGRSVVIAVAALALALVAYVSVGLVVGGMAVWIAGAVLLVIGGVIATWLVRKRDGQSLLGTIWPWMRQNLALFAVLGIAVLGPAAALYFGTELQDIVGFQSGHAVMLRAGSIARSVVVGRSIQLIFIIVLSALPALLYFQFDRDRLSTLRRRWNWQIFRFDPAMQTLSDVRAKYGANVDEAYEGPKKSRTLRGNPTPLIITTVLLAIGWLLLLMNSQIRSVENAVVNGQPVQQSINFFDLINPAPKVVAFAFLGGYFFLLELTIRGYVRGDLQPKHYSAATARIIKVVILAWLLQSMNPSLRGADLALLVAFFVGYLPDSAVRWLCDVASSAVAKAPFASELKEKGPLSDIDDIGLYERARLYNEGITSVQAFATHDVVDLLLKTRIPAARLIDWLDQAILRLHLDPLYANEGGASQALGRFGIRGVSDLLDVVPAPAERAGHATITALAPAGEHGEDQFLMALTVIDRSEWVGYVRNWRRSPLASTGPKTWCFLDETGELQHLPPNEQIMLDFFAELDVREGAPR
jgi:hypothetical protein